MATSIDLIFENFSIAKSRISEIYQELEGEKITQAELVSLNSNSKTASWRLWGYVTAVCQYVLQVLFDDHKKEMNNLAAAVAGGSVSWYIKKAKEFQFGDILELINDIPAYPVLVGEDDAKRVIKFAAMEETLFGGSVLKVAALEGSEFVPLEEDQKTAFNGYIEQLHFAGSMPAVVSNPADEFRVFATVYYNPLYDLPTLKNKIASAIDLTRRNLSEKGEIFTESVQDAIQGVEGVRKGVVIQKIEARKNAGVWAIVQRKYKADAGYIILDPLTSLNTSITYIPE